MTTEPPKPQRDPSKSPPKHIANPRRLLILTPTSQSLSTIPPLLHSLTGVPVHDPPQQSTTPQIEQPVPSQSAHAVAEPRTTPAFAGYTTHSPLRLQTKYYTAEVPVWVDEIPLSENVASKDIQGEAGKSQDQDTVPPSATQWRAEFLSDEAQIVREAVGALVVCALSPGPRTGVYPGSGGAQDLGPDPVQRGDVCAVRELMREVGAVKGCIDEERGGVGSVPGVLVLVGPRKSGASSVSGEGGHGGDGLGFGGDGDDLGDELADVPFSIPWWEDQLFDMGLFGWEVVEWDPVEQGGEKRRNRFGEFEGMPRIKEVLETHDWTSAGDTSLDDEGLDPELDLDDEFDDELLGFGRSSHTPGFGQEVNELEREMLGLRMAIERGGDGFGDSDGEEDEEGKVESMEALMMRVQGIRDMSSELPESERKTFAAKAVQDLMREL